MDRAEFDFLRPSCSWHWVQSSLRVDHPFPVPWQKIHKIQWLRAHAVFKCFQLILSICSEHFLKAHLVANASAGSAGHGGAPLAAVVVVIILLWLFLSSCSCCCCCSSSSSSSIFLLSQTPKLHPISSFFLEPTSTKHGYLLCFVDIPAPNLDICCVLYRPSKKPLVFTSNWTCQNTAIYSVCVLFAQKDYI